MVVPYLGYWRAPGYDGAHHLDRGPVEARVRGDVDSLAAAFTLA